MKLNTYELGLGGGSLLQLATRIDDVKMGYIIDTPDGKVIVIDGGAQHPDEADCLYKELQKRGNHVDLWIMTHAHNDHVGSLAWLMEHLPIFDITIDKLCYHFPAREWLATKEGWACNETFLHYVEKLGLNVVTPQAGDILECGGISVEILNIPEDYQDYPSINPTTMMFVMHFPAKDVLFMGDFDVYGQAEFLRKFDASKLRCDVAQMAHHGQAGTDRSFYDLVQPKYCLYNAPLWLYDNYPWDSSDPTKKGLGPFTSMETRQWMAEMGVIENFTFVDGDWLFT